jgi:hypothetical protein
MQALPDAIVLDRPEQGSFCITAILHNLNASEGTIETLFATSICDTNDREFECCSTAIEKVTSGEHDARWNVSGEQRLVYSNKD